MKKKIGLGILISLKCLKKKKKEAWALGPCYPLDNQCVWEPDYQFKEIPMPSHSPF